MFEVWYGNPPKSKFEFGNFYLVPFEREIDADAVFRVLKSYSEKNACGWRVMIFDTKRLVVTRCADAPALPGAYK